MLRPFFLEIVESTPKWGYPAFNLNNVSKGYTSESDQDHAYHQLPYDALTEVLMPGIDAHSH